MGVPASKEKLGKEKKSKKDRHSEGTGKPEDTPEKKKSKSKKTPKKSEGTGEVSSPEGKESKGDHKQPTSPSITKEDPEGEDLGDVITKYSRKVSKDDFELLTVIGRGSFGKVMQVRKKGTNEIYALKVMRKDAIIQKKQVTHTKDEKAILQQIAHPFIVKLHYAFQTKDKLYMVLDYINGGELFFHLKKEGKFNVDRVRLYAAEIASAMAHLHSLGIVYRDLKPENILLDKDGHVVITDFGLSKIIPKDSKEGTHTFCGTPEYLAPEVLCGQGHSHAVDWWSLGTLIFEMLTGLPPFYSKNINVMYQKILSAQLAFPSYVDDDAKSLLEGLLERDVNKRFRAEQVRVHPFFKDIEWEKLYKREIEAPWKPGVKSATDISQIDEYFTKEEAVDSYVPNGVLDEADEDAFEGFTFAGDSNLN
eukprot:TRINITY_DN2450_c0_g2_i3.p1 TRINITY_DN2450_c0_g2~~TRINITY_DN2450_c0_g2_i3.p1  ORF type:complete len:421 (-),score=96.71 TRINITY_DN2450_c0_g2_i3:80-1342(-)